MSKNARTTTPTGDDSEDAQALAEKAKNDAAFKAGNCNATIVAAAGIINGMTPEEIRRRILAVQGITE